MKVLVTKLHRKAIHCIGLNDTELRPRGAMVMLARMHARQHMEDRNPETKRNKTLEELLQQLKDHGYTFHWLTINTNQCN